MTYLNVTDFIKSVTVEHTDYGTNVVEDPCVINQLSCLLATMSQDNALELKMFLDEGGKSMNVGISNDEKDWEESFLFCNSEYENDDIVLNNRVNGGSITANTNKGEKKMENGILENSRNCPA